MNIDENGIRHWFLKCLLTLVVTPASLFSWAGEYQLAGKLDQTITGANGLRIRSTATFSVFVRDCNWLIETTESDEKGRIYKREIGSTNGSEIYECLHPVLEVRTNSTKADKKMFQNPESPTGPAIATIISNGIPVGAVDTAIAGHLWLMLASQCYWPSLNTTALTPLYDWHASVAAGGEKRTVRARWQLLAGQKSLPQEVVYLGRWDETNGLYRITGSNWTGGMLIPSGFVFEEYYVGPLEPGRTIHSMVLRKRVVVEVTSAHPFCDRADLLPLPPANTVVIDRRVAGSVSNVSLAGNRRAYRPPSYINPGVGKWVMPEEATKLAAAMRRADDQAIAEITGVSRFQNESLHRNTVLVVLVCAFMLGPVGIYLAWRASRRKSGQS